MPTLFKFTMSYRQFIPQKCLQPVRVFDARRNCYSYVRCGHCDACKFSYQSTWRNRLETHARQKGIYTVFITLTYDNENLPLVHYDFDGNILGLEYTDVRRLPRSNRLKKTRKFKSCTFDDFDLSNFWKPHFVKSRNGNNLYFDTSDSFAICWLPDVQKFLKRLRTNLSRESSLCGEDLSLSYFICSEYGPKTFRPHYHGLLFFKSLAVAMYVINEGVFKAWNKQSNSVNAFTGSRIASLVTQEGAASAYVSKYVTSFSSLPPLLKQSPFRCFHMQSISIPLGSEAFDLDVVPSMLAKDDFLHNISYIDKKTKERVDLQLPYPLASWRRVFPKFLCDSCFTVSQKRRAFHLLHQLCRDGVSLPDLRQQVIDKYHLGSPVFIGSKWHKENINSVPYWVHKCNVSFDDFLSHFDTEYCQINKIDRDTFSKFVKVSNRHRHCVSLPVAFDTIKPSDIIDTDWIDAHLELYLFGFDQNLSACRKIIKCMRTVSWCCNPNDYLDYYLKYELKSFSQSLAERYKNCLSLPCVEPCDLVYMYPSFFSELPQDLSVLTEDKYNLLDSFTSMYGFDISDFYDDNGKIIAYSYLSSSAGISYLRDLDNLKTKQKTMTQYNHDASFDL